ncbi:nucleoside triphosphate pyrophosphohydrolase [Dyadobacter pollutisoli]|jgi:XTP/dITP diphosphohydrolase|uniref:Nucleoside triphosphate pyrophosphohydrolase n=1 Tax=Dyadobacter pollutisoli TaxID=2910158 RepID=A0A9E8NB09_9BACT|nr:nucleoside triphosphate pyrophosphohydrolase [Dyadobacter pollutisoli]WAC11736.1 nucleoside triphosphate pyrophosphohydrolase [Dyadobacter pollutisoli]
MEKQFNDLSESRQQQLMAFDRLLTIMDELREQCPWDRKQTMDSLRHLTIEETYELSDAIIENDSPEIKKELGDVLLHIVFYAKIGSEARLDNGFQFDIKDVLDGICDKLVSRHPHIYGDFVADSEEAVKQNWEKLKLKEGNKSVLSGVPASLPALVKAMRIQEKARGVGFDWDDKRQVWGKVEEELAEFKDNFNIETGEVLDQKEAEGEFGDLLFSLVNYSRFVDINPETALERTNKKFIRRFQYLEEASKADGKSLAEMTLDEMDEYWNEAKKLNA